jgi:hypothetical protein
MVDNVFNKGSPVWIKSESARYERMMESHGILLPFYQLRPFRMRCFDTNWLPCVAG